MTEKEAYSILDEDTRTLLLNKSKAAGRYKTDTTRGATRYDRRKFSHVEGQAKSFNTIDMNDLFKKDLLQVDIPVAGETDNYTVTVRMDGVVAEMQKNIKNNKYKFEFRTVIQALTKAFNTTNIFVKCTCDDFKYNYAHWNIINRVSVDDTAHDPGPGRNIRNPNDDKGRGCKHILLVLDNGDWLMKVASVISNYVKYAEQNLQKPFLAIRFPKLYGMSAEDAVGKDLIDSEDSLKNTNGLIEYINGLNGKPAAKPEQPGEEDEK